MHGKRMLEEKKQAINWFPWSVNNSNFIYLHFLKSSYIWRMRFGFHWILIYATRVCKLYIRRFTTYAKSTESELWHRTTIIIIIITAIKRRREKNREIFTLMNLLLVFKTSKQRRRQRRTQIKKNTRHETIISAFNAMVFILYGI